MRSRKFFGLALSRNVFFGLESLRFLNGFLNDPMIFLHNTWHSCKPLELLVIVYGSPHDTKNVSFLRTHSPVQYDFEKGVEAIYKLIRELNLIQLVNNFYETTFFPIRSRW